MKGKTWLYYLQKTCSNTDGDITGAEYIRLSREKVDFTHTLRDGLNIDLDKDGNVVGIEIV